MNAMTDLERSHLQLSASLCCIFLWVFGAELGERIPDTCCYQPVSLTEANSQTDGLAGCDT